MMKRSLLILSILVVGAVGALPSADWKANVRLSLDESLVLPGTPTGITVLASNLGNSDLRLPPLLWLVATKGDGSSFPLRNLLSREGTPIAVPEDARTIPAGETRELRFDVPETVQGAHWLLDERIVLPGRYELRAVFTEEMDQTARFDVATALASNPVQYSVDAPGGDEARIWTWMREAAGGAWGEKAWFRQPGRLAEFVLSNYPESRYALYTAYWAPCCDVERQNAIIRHAIETHRGIAFADQLELALARRLEQQYSVAYSRGEIERAAEKLAGAREVATRLRDEARSSVIRAAAKTMVERLPTDEALREGARLKEHHIDQ